MTFFAKSPKQLLHEALNECRKFHIGDKVYGIEDPRHIGVIYKLVANSADIQWEESGWKSEDMPLNTLRKAR